MAGGGVTVTQPTSPSLPSNVAATVPAAVIKAVSFLLAAVGVGLPWWNPWHLTSDGARALIAVAFVIIAAVIFTIHVVLAAVHEYGFSTRALDKVEADEIAGLKQLWPDLQATWTQAKPALDQLPGVADRLTQVEQVATEVKGKVDAIPADQLAAVATALHALAPQPAITNAPVAPSPAVTPPAPAGA